MTNVIEIDGPHKSYRRLKGTAVALGGLARPTAGNVQLLRRPVPGGLRDAICQTGAIVETPALFPTMTCRENLRLLASVDRIGPRRANEMLDQVGLGDRADDLVKRDSIAEARTSPSLVFPVVALIPNSTRVGRSLPRWLVVLLALVGVPVALQALMALFGLLAGAS